MLGIARPSVAMLEPSTTKCGWGWRDELLVMEILIVESDAVIRAVFWDFGGVILSSPFEAFNAYEESNGIPLDFIRGVNATNPDDNAWAKIERRQISHDEFDALFAAESEALGHRIPGRDVIGMLYGTVRPEMVVALDRVIDAGYVTACLTNNFATDHQRDELEAIMARFDHVIESSKVGVRKPEPAFYDLACTEAGVVPDEVVFLDDLGINLKPARAIGMTTIKVGRADQAISELEAVLGIELR
jgi:putative hydrolase of the HAD superfamily